jgi:hypothetical protein
MTHILYTKDNMSGLYIIPVRCERVNWKTCPQHKILRDKPDRTHSFAPMLDSESALPPKNGIAWTEGGLTWVDYNNASNPVDTVAGFEYSELYSAGMAGDEIMSARTRPPAGSTQNFSWKDVVLQSEAETGYSNSIYKGYIVAEALVDDISSLQRRKYDNLPENPQARLSLLQEDGEKYHALAKIVMSNKDGVFSSTTQNWADKVYRKVGYAGGRTFAPVSKNSSGEWEIDNDVAQLLMFTASDVKKLPQHAVNERERTIATASNTASKYNVYENAGSSLNNAGTIDRFRNETSRKPSEKLVQTRIRKRLLELELQEFDRSSPNPVVGLFTSNRRKTERGNIVEQLSNVEQELRYAENE